MSNASQLTALVFEVSRTVFKVPRKSGARDQRRELNVKKQNVNFI